MKYRRLLLFLLVSMGAALSLAHPFSAVSTPAPGPPLRPTFPPLPTATPRPTPTPPPTTPPGAFIELRMTPPDPTLWTQVEWQDGLGAWHRVDGWQGTLDAVEGAVGIKRWWLDSSHFGQGPFRWVALREREGEMVATSEPFTLPTAVYGLTIVPLAIAP